MIGVRRCRTSGTSSRILLESVYFFASSITSLVIAIPLDGPRNRGVSSSSCRRTSPPFRTISSVFNGSPSSSVYCASSASKARTLSCSFITYVRDIFFPLAVSKYSHMAPARSHGRHLGRLGSHLVFLYLRQSALLGNGPNGNATHLSTPTTCRQGMGDSRRVIVALVALLSAEGFGFPGPTDRALRLSKQLGRVHQSRFAGAPM